jgi:hypothetical protein
VGRRQFELVRQGKHGGSVSWKPLLQSWAIRCFKSVTATVLPYVVLALQESVRRTLLQGDFGPADGGENNGISLYKNPLNAHPMEGARRI